MQKQLNRLGLTRVWAQRSISSIR